MGWPQASPREPLRCHISSLVIVETLKYSCEETQTGQTLLWSPVNHNSTLRDHISKSREITEHYCCILYHIRSNLTPQASRTRCSGSTVPAHCLLAPAARRPSRPVVHQRERSTRCPRRRVRAAQAGQKVCGGGTVAGLRRRARRTRAADGQSVPAREPRERAQKELAVTRCRAVVVLWRLCTVGKVRLQQGSTMVVPCCSLA